MVPGAIGYIVANGVAATAGAGAATKALCWAGAAIGAWLGYKWFKGQVIRA